MLRFETVEQLKEWLEAKEYIYIVFNKYVFAYNAETGKKKIFKLRRIKR